MKLIGAFLIGLASFAAAKKHESFEKNRIKAMRSLCMALELMEAELSAKICPINELCCFLAERSELEVKYFFNSIICEMNILGEKSFSEIWIDAARGSFCFLDKDELEELCLLGDVLGKFELDKQLESIKICRMRFTDVYSKNYNAFPEKKKMRMAALMAFGAMLIIVLV